MRVPSVRFTRRRIILALGMVLFFASLITCNLFQNHANAKFECRRNLRLMSVMLLGYDSVKGSFPSATIPNEKLTPEHRLSWFIESLAFLQGWGGPLSVRLDEGWNSAENRSLNFSRQDKSTGEKTTYSGNDMHCFMCPAANQDATTEHPTLTHYVGIAGVGADAPTLALGHPRAGVFGYDRRTRKRDITDGLSTTMMIAETFSKNGWWTAGGPATVRGVDPSDRPYIGKGRPLGGLHAGGAMVAFVDGSVHFVRDSIDPKVFEALATVAGGEKISGGWDEDE